MHTAAEHEQIDCITLLIANHGGNLINHQNNDGWTPLHVACEKGHDVCVSKMIKIGADISIQDLEGMIPLHTIVV